MDGLPVYSPITSDLGRQVLFDTLDIWEVQLSESRVSEDHGPRHDGSDFALAIVEIGGKTSAQVE